MFRNSGKMFRVNIVKEKKMKVEDFLNFFILIKGGEAIVHKTFHSYTVRARQGTSQNNRDGRLFGHTKSAGASLRRYNEAAFIQVK